MHNIQKVLKVLKLQKEQKIQNVQKVQKVQHTFVLILLGYFLDTFEYFLDILGELLEYFWDTFGIYFFLFLFIEILVDLTTYNILDQQKKLNLTTSIM